MSASLHDVALGPLSLPLLPLLLFGMAWAVARAAGVWVRHRTGDASSAEAARAAVIGAVMWGLVGARLTHLALHAEAYLAVPWAALDLRDGGWNHPAGLAVGVAFLAWQVRRHAAWRRPLTTTGALGLALWLGTVAFLAAPASPLPTLTFTPLDGSPPRSLGATARGRPLVLNLWASWCGPCRQEMPTFAAAQRRERDVDIVFVNQGETAAAVRAFLIDQGLDLHNVLLDPGHTLGKAVGSRGLPTTLFYDAQGRLVDAHRGVLNSAALESRLRALAPAAPR